MNDYHFFFFYEILPNNSYILELITDIKKNTIFFWSLKYFNYAMFVIHSNVA